VSDGRALKPRNPAMPSLTAYGGSRPDRDEDCLGWLGMNKERLKGNMDLLLLSVLSAGPAHGYAIITALRARSDGTFDLPEGTVYPALHRLEAAGLLSSSWSEGDGRKRRVYSLTGQGELALSAERTEWKRFTGGVQAVLGWQA